ncbi:DEAD/DEAH box helicase [Segeticoccus rhizosphaerae]|uniref:DEAD/DEAH box helicase n=1 Tax=Segeticoccus rhizosphaerae TaxID=1104777 RepID=UPI0010BF752A|nr:DEAD/DEAH box helicase [Ornithinicoccus soli]
MDHGWLDGLSDEAITAVAGSGAFQRGTAYSREGRVEQLTKGGGGTLFATVRGSAREAYSVLVTGQDTVGPASFQGRCTCPMSVNCKHVVAVLLTARESATRAGGADGAGSWELPFAGIVEAQAEPERQGVPLGLQFEVVSPRRPASHRFSAADAARMPRRLKLDPVMQGARGTWIRTGVSWRDLGYGYTRQSTNPAHVDALSEFFFAHQARTQRHQYAAGGQAIYLDELGPSLWPMLDQLREAGITLVGAKSARGGVAVAAGPAQASLDLRRRPDGDTVVEPVVTLEGAVLAAGAVQFMGRPAHGFFVEGSDELGAGRLVSPGALLLCRLDRPATGEVSRLLYDGRRIDIPASDLGRFLQKYYPALRQALRVASSDETVQLPEIRPPRLALTATYAEDHHVSLDWEFAYTVGEDVARVPLHGPAKAIAARDRKTEQALLDGLDLPSDRLPQLVTNVTGQPTLVPRVRLSGLNTAVFTEDVLPALQERDDLLVEVVGTPQDYRFTDSAPLISVSTTDSRDDADWFDLGVMVTVDGEQMPLVPLFTALARGESHLLLDSGTWLRIDRPELQQLRELIEEARELQDRESDGLRISSYQAGFWEELVALGVVDSQSRRWDGTVQGLLEIDQVAPPPDPAGLEAELRPYQREGYHWLSFLHDHELGGILADDMGLGKTVQTLAMALRAFESEKPPSPFLVVAPTSVVSGWAHEAARFAPTLRVATVTETSRKRRTSLAEHVGDAQVVVTSYALLRLDYDAYAELPWGALILDEAQFVKNHQSKVHQCARRLPAPFKLAITGTPLENNLMELWSLLSVTAPGLFPNPQRFTDLFARPIERGTDPDRLDTLRRRIRPLMRRRRKEQVVAELPPKQEQVLEVPLNAHHRRIYQTHLQRERAKILGLIDDMAGNRFAIFRSLTLLRQLALAPELIDQDYVGVRSSKVDALLEQLEEVVSEGHRALVFSQFTGFLGLVRRRLEAEGIAYAYLDGSTRHRGEVIEGFKSGEAPVFLISLKAGGFGLNLTEADYCFVMDPWWNPAAEAQAVDRAHRIGQERTVMVYRLVSTETIEEKVMDLKARKMGLFTQVMDGDPLLAAPLSADDIKGLFEH